MVSTLSTGEGSGYTSQALASSRALRQLLGCQHTEPGSAHEPHQPRSAHPRTAKPETGAVGEAGAGRGSGKGQVTHLSSPGDGDGARQQVPDDILQGHAQPIHVDGVDQTQAVLERKAEWAECQGGSRCVRVQLGKLQFGAPSCGGACLQTETHPMRASTWVQCLRSSLSDLSQQIPITRNTMFSTCSVYFQPAAPPHPSIHPRAVASPG